MGNSHEFRSDAHKPKQSGTSISPSDLGSLNILQTDYGVDPIFAYSENGVFAPRRLDNLEISNVNRIAFEVPTFDEAKRNCEFSSRGLILQQIAEFYLIIIYAKHLQYRFRDQKTGESIFPTHMDALKSAIPRFYTEAFGNGSEMSNKAAYLLRMFESVESEDPNPVDLNGRETTERTIGKLMQKYLQSLKVHLHSEKGDFVLDENETRKVWDECWDAEDITAVIDSINSLFHLGDAIDPEDTLHIFRERIQDRSKLVRLHIEKFCQVSVLTNGAQHSRIAGVESTAGKRISSTIRSTPDIIIRPNSRYALVEDPLILIDIKTGKQLEKARENPELLRMELIAMIISSNFSMFQGNGKERFGIRYPKVNFENVEAFLHDLAYQPDLIRIGYYNIDPRYEDDRYLQLFPDQFTEGMLCSPEELYIEFMRVFKNVLKYTHFKRINKDKIKFTKLGNSGYPKLTPNLGFDFDSGADHTYTKPSL